MNVHEKLKKEVADEIKSECQAEKLSYYSEELDPVVKIAVRVAIERMAGCFKLGYNQGGHDQDGLSPCEAQCLAHMKEYGLIPDEKQPEHGE